MVLSRSGTFSGLLDDIGTRGRVPGLALVYGFSSVALAGQLPLCSQRVLPVVFVSVLRGYCPPVAGLRVAGAQLGPANSAMWAVRRTVCLGPARVSFPAFGLLSAAAACETRLRAWCVVL